MSSFKLKNTKICHALGPGFLSTSFDKRRSKAESTAMRMSLSQPKFTRQIMARFSCDHFQFFRQLHKIAWLENQTGLTFVMF